MSSSLTPLLLLAAIALITLLAPALAPRDPRSADSPALLPPSKEHPFGTDTLGRDVFSRTLWGGRQTLGIALLGTGIAVLPGLLVGALAGFFGGWTDRLLTATIDTLLAFPSLLLALTLIALTGSGPAQVALAVGLAGLPAYARVTRAAVIAARGQPYIEAAQAIGARPLRVLLRHALPNTREPLLGFAAVSFSWAVINGAGLVFLGFGGDPATPDWGAMLNEGRAAFRTAPWIALLPGALITLTAYAVHRLADAWGARETIR